MAITSLSHISYQVVKRGGRGFEPRWSHFFYLFSALFFPSIFDFFFADTSPTHPCEYWMHTKPLQRVTSSDSSLVEGFGMKVSISYNVIQLSRCSTGRSNTKVDSRDSLHDPIKVRHPRPSTGSDLLLCLCFDPCPNSSVYRASCFQSCSCRFVGNLP